MIKDFAIGQGNAGGICVDSILVDDGVGDVGSVVIDAPIGLGLEIQLAVGEIKVVVAKDAFSRVFALFVGVALGEGDEKSLAGHCSIGDLNKAFFIRLQECFRKGLFPDGFSGVGVEANGVNVLPKIFGGLASGGIAFEFGIAAFEEAQFSIGKGNGRINDKSASVRPSTFPFRFGVTKYVVAENIRGVGVATDFVIPGIAEVFFKLGSDSHRGTDDRVPFLSDISPFVAVAVVGGEF